MAGSSRVLWGIAVAVGVLGGGLATVRAQAVQVTATSGPRVYIADTRAKGVVASAIRGAAHRLSREDCRSVLDDFTDAEGQRLAAKLDAPGLEPAAYLVERLWWVDGSDSPQCRRPDAPPAFTAPNNKVVYVCPARLASQPPGPATWLELLLIHELLHTLGLRENPPSSTAITQQVTRRCGRS